MFPLNFVSQFHFYSSENMVVVAASGWTPKSYK